MSWRLRVSVEAIIPLTPAVPGSTVFAIAGVVRRPRVPRRPGGPRRSCRKPREAKGRV